MAVDSELAALIVRVTARVSAVVFATSLLAAARRLGGGDTGMAAARRADLAAFAAFVVMHTIHFAAVALLAVVTAGQNIRDAGGYTATAVGGLTFYAACAAVVLAKARGGSGWPSVAERRIEVWTSMGLWLIFFQAYALRLGQSLLFVAMAIGLAAALGRFLARARAARSSNIQRSSVGVS
jgi:hypothetical protein